ncbi:MAG TPA: type II secretion system F family protein [Polyangia bacterium]|jgi:tight adherence protein B
MRAILIGVITVATFALIEGLFHTIRYFRERKQDELKRRLQSLGSTSSETTSLLRKGNLSGNPALDALLRTFPLAARTEAMLEQAEVRITVARLFTIAGVGALVGAIAGLLSNMGYLLSLLLAPLGAIVPFMYVGFMRDRRNNKLSEQLPDALDMMARSLRAGHALASSFKLVAAEMPSPINTEFARAFEEQNLGMPFERAIEQMTKRAPNNRDLKIFAVSVIVQKETGGNLVEIIEKIAETVRARYRFYGKLQTLTAEGRMSCYILAALPILTAIFIAFTNPEYSKLLITDHIGHMAVAYAVVTWVAGLTWMRRMMKVEA